MMDKKEKKKVPIEGYASFVLLFAMTFIMFIGVVSRYFFNASLSWTEELARYMFVWFIFISMSYAVTQRAHIRIDAINSIIPVKIRPYTNILGKIVWLAFSLFVTYLGITYAMDLTNSVSAALNLPMTFVYFGIPIGYFLMSIRLLVQIIQAIKNPQLEIKDIEDDAIKESD